MVILKFQLIPRQWFEESLFNHNFKVVPIFLHWSHFNSQGSIHDPFSSSFKTIDKSLEVQDEDNKNKNKKRNLVKKTTYIFAIMQVLIHKVAPSPTTP